MIPLLTPGTQVTLGTQVFLRQLQGQVDLVDSAEPTLAPLDILDSVVKAGTQDIQEVDVRGSRGTQGLVDSADALDFQGSPDSAVDQGTLDFLATVVFLVGAGTQVFPGQVGAGSPGTPEPGQAGSQDTADGVGTAVFLLPVRVHPDSAGTRDILDTPVTVEAE